MGVVSSCEDEFSPRRIRGIMNCGWYTLEEVHIHPFSYGSKNEVEDEEMTVARYEVVIQYTNPNHDIPKQQQSKLQILSITPIR